MNMLLTISSITYIICLLLMVSERFGRDSWKHWAVFLIGIISLAGISVSLQI